MRDDEEEEDNDPAGTVMEACRSYDLPKLLRPVEDDPPDITPPSPEATPPRNARRAPARRT